MKYPRSFWKRGPAAFELSKRAYSILESLSSQKKHFLSLRRSASELSVAHTTLTRWVEDGIIRREGPGGKIAVEELKRFLQDLERKSKPPPPKSSRFKKRYFWSFQILAEAKFVWPVGQPSLTPTELADLIGCHASTIRRALSEGILEGIRPSPYRWIVPEYAWFEAFPEQLQEK